MIDVRPFSSLGGSNHGWLDTKHHFSFADYQDPHRVHWGTLRVWNDDTIAANTGFPPHPHANMEIITYVRKGAITHQDSIGSLGRTGAGDVQVMSAGTGIRHSEYNREAEDSQIFQIWIIPDEQGGEPRWGTKPFPKENRDGKFVTLASGMEGDEDALMIRSNARVVGASIKAGQTIEYTFSDENRYGYLVPALGSVHVNDIALHEGDGAAIHGETTIRVTADTDAEVVLVDSAAL